MTRVIDPKAVKAPAGTSAGAVVPGQIELELRAPASPMAAGTNAPPAMTAAAGGALNSLNQLLQKHSAQAILPSFSTPPAPAAAALPPGAVGPAGDLQRFVTVSFPAGADTVQIAAELRSDPNVVRAVPIPKVLPPSEMPTDPLLGNSDQVVAGTGGLENQWYAFRCGAPAAWNSSQGSGVILADIDWGCRTSHADLRDRIDSAKTYNAFDGSSNVAQGSSVFHGTGVCGLACATANGAGMVGFAPEATLWPIEADYGTGAALPGNSWANAILWVIQQDGGGKRKVIILEVQTQQFGNIESVPSVSQAIKMAIAANIVVCVAAGNGDRSAAVDDQGQPIPPTGSILVGATSYDPAVNQRAYFSNFGPTVIVSAPGDSNHDVTATNTGDQDFSNDFGGTSGATPKVAGTAALMLSANPGLTHADVRSILASTGKPVTTDAGKPIGVLLDANAAVQEALRRLKK